MTIKQKIILSFLAVSLLIGMLGGMTFLHNISEADHIAQHEARTISSTLALDLAPQLKARSDSSLSLLNAEISHLRDIHGRDVVVVDIDRKIVADVIPFEIGTRFEHDPGDEVGQTLRDGKPRTFTEISDAYPDGIRQLVYPVDAMDGQRVGAIVLEYTPLNKEILSIIKEDAIRFLMLYIIALSIALLLGYVISEHISKPLNKMKSAVMRIAGGDLDATVDYRAEDELGMLASRFNQMARDMKAARQDLLDTNRRLEQDVERRTAAEKALEESEGRLITLIDAIPAAIIFKDTEGRHLLANRANETMFGLGREELLGKTVEDVLPSEIAEKCTLADKAVLSGHELVRHEEKTIGKQGSDIFLETIRVPLYDSSGNPMGLVMIASDITQRKLAESKIMESEEKFRSIFESASDAIFIVDMEGNLLDVNEIAYSRLGYTKEEMLSMSITELLPQEFREKMQERMEQIKEAGTSVFESAHVRKDGGIMPVESNVKVMDFMGEKVFFSVVRDISERKAADERIIASLKEKEILLQEIHHRVKNNMAVVISLLKLQARRVGNSEARQVLLESQNRIRAMALIHEKLYLEEDLLKINYKKYIQTLVSELFSTYKGVEGDIKCIIDAEEVKMTIDTAIPCGLIINELVTNSLKYAFEGVKYPIIRISLAHDERDRLILTVSDNGIGMPDDIDVSGAKSLGLQIVDGLVRQLRGAMELDRTDGTTYRITFKEAGAAARTQEVA